MAATADRSLIDVDKTEYWFTKKACTDEAGALKLLYEQPQIASKTKAGAPGATPLMIALENRASDAVVRKLLDYFPAAAAITHNGSLPLHIAAKLGVCGPLVVEHLLQVHPDAVRAKEAHDDEFLPVHLAMRHAQVQEKVVHLLVAHYPFHEMSLVDLIKCGEQNAWDQRRSRAPATEAALRLLELDPTLAQEARALDEALPLHMAFIYGSADELCIRLLEVFPEAARRPDKKGNRPINIAAQHNRSQQVMRCLLAA
mmetsp:Transcript_9511/g.19238  ORF Transcript_9511/g.19238 Transcript_9511/m.19238 type:complete len:257 (+) Transcript_9511:163-933(+)